MRNVGFIPKFIYGMTSTVFILTCLIPSSSGSNVLLHDSILALGGSINEILCGRVFAFHNKMQQKMDHNTKSFENDMVFLNVILSILWKQLDADSQKYYNKPYTDLQRWDNSRWWSIFPQSLDA